jgi:DeoR family transcriptional regulator of aga operon
LIEFFIISEHTLIQNLGVDGIHAEIGITTHSESEARMAKILMQRSEKSIAVFDSSKIDKCSLFQINPLSSIKAVVSDCPLSEILTTACRSENILIY